MTSKSELREEIDRLKQQVAELMGTNGTLESWRASWLNGYDAADHVDLQTTHSAFTQLLQHLGAEHMTAAVMRIRELVALEKDSPTRLELMQQKATAEHNVSIHKLAIRQLEFQRDSAQKNDFDTGFELANVKARCEELEELLSEIRQGHLHFGWQLGISIPGKIDAMLGPTVAPMPGSDK